MLPKRLTRWPHLKATFLQLLHEGGGLGCVHRVSCNVEDALLVGLHAADIILEAGLLVSIVAGG